MCKYADVQMICVDVMALNQQPPLRYTYKLLKELVFYLHICPLAYLQICFGGGYRSRTDDPPDMLVGMHLSNWANLYTTYLVEDIGVEPMTLCVQGRCSSQLS